MSSSTSDSSAASHQTPNVYSVGISAPYANIAGATVTSPTLSVQHSLPAHLPTLQMQSNQMKTPSMPVQLHTVHPQVPINTQMPMHAQVPINTQTPMQPQVPINTYTPSMNFDVPMSTQTPMQPPLLHQSPERSVGQPFRVVLTNSRISRCQGCRGQINRNYDQIVLQHKEHVLSTHWSMADVPRFEKHLLSC